VKDGKVMNTYCPIAGACVKIDILSY